MGEPKKLPHGMTPNMVKIMEAQRMAREQGLKSYGRFISRGDTSALEPKPGKDGERVCQRCGAELSHRGSGAKYCEECALIVNREKNLERYHATHQTKWINCADCGALVQVKSGTQKYCSTCSEIRFRERQYEYAKKRRAERKAKADGGE